jgi:hypothetical protein
MIEMEGAWTNPDNRDSRDAIAWFLIDGKLDQIVDHPMAHRVTRAVCR